MTTKDQKQGEPLDSKSFKIGETQEIYFIIIYTREEKEKPEELKFKKMDNPPQCIYDKKIKSNNEKKNLLIWKVN